MSFQPWSVSSLLRLRCPACGGNTFRRGLFRTAPSCGACGQVFDRESGFYAGSIYPMYALSGLIGGLAILAGFLAGLSFAECLGLAGAAVVLGSPWIFWYARLSFLHADHRFFGDETGPAKGSNAAAHADARKPGCDAGHIRDKADP